MVKGKKAQNAASRKDTFYKRAKERGYRARSAFKLVHLNNLHNFLKKAHICIDLCAAPGSWMQVAREFMPSGGLIVGVDLYNIKPIPKTLSIKGDITTEFVRSELRQKLNGSKADVVLHDGAPNVGKNWSQDAYDQNLLVLHSFKLACEFLRYGGDFVTKVFRSKDSPSLEFVFKSLFKKVESTKPQASRYESAEIFYVCRHFKLRTGDKADPKFFDPREVFKDVELTQAKKINLHKPEKVNKKATGYEDGVEILYKETTVTDFVESDHHEEVLQQTSALVFDEARWLTHPNTTDEIKECCKDVKVLGRRELRMLLGWRKALRAELDAIKKVLSEEEKKAEEAKAAAARTPEEEENEEMEKVQQQIEELEAKATQEDKKQQRAVRKQRRLLQQRLKMMAMAGDADGARDDDLFDLKAMETITDENVLLDQYDAFDDEEKAPPRPKYIRFKRGEYELGEDGCNYKRVGDVSDSDSESDVPEVGEPSLFKKKAAAAAKKKLKMAGGIEMVKADPSASNLKKKKSVRFANAGSDSSDFHDTTDEEDSADEGEEGTKEPVASVNETEGEEGAARDGASDQEGGEDDDEDSGVGEGEGDGRFTTDLVGDIPEEKRERTMETWFTQHSLLNDVDSNDEEDCDLELEGAIRSYKKSGGGVVGEEDDEVDDGVPMEKENSKQKKQTQEEDGSKGSVAADESKAPPVATKKRLPDLDAVGLALATEMVKTKKARRDMELKGWNRYMKGEEEGLPQWFKEDEEKNMAPNLEPNAELVQYYTARDRAVNARTLKKVMEAKVRKQRRFKKAMQKVVKKTEALQGSSLMTDYEKQQEMKNLYKKAMHSREKKDRTYVVMKKGHKGQKPKGTTGRYKLVDARLKSDVRAKLKLDKKKKTYGRKKAKGKK